MKTLNSLRHNTTSRRQGAQRLKRTSHSLSLAVRVPRRQRRMTGLVNTQSRTLPNNNITNYLIFTYHLLMSIFLIPKIVALIIMMWHRHRIRLRESR